MCFYLKLTAEAQGAQSFLFLKELGNKGAYPGKAEDPENWEQCMNTRYLVPSLPLILLCISPRSSDLSESSMYRDLCLCGNVFSGRIEIQITYFLRFGKTVAFIFETR